jgi:hypothetical protein
MVKLFTMAALTQEFSPKLSAFMIKLVEIINYKLVTPYILDQTSRLITLQNGKFGYLEGFLNFSLIFAASQIVFDLKLEEERISKIYLRKFSSLVI